MHITTLAGVVSILVSAAAIDPQSINTAERARALGSLSRIARDYNEALGFFERCLALEPENSKCIFGKAQTFYSIGVSHYAQAAILFASLIETKQAQKPSAAEYLVWINAKTPLTASQEALMNQELAETAKRDINRSVGSQTEKACSDGDASACYAVGKSIFDPLKPIEKVPNSPHLGWKMAVQFFVHACELGLWDGCREAEQAFGPTAQHAFSKPNPLLPGLVQATLGLCSGAVLGAALPGPCDDPKLRNKFEEEYQAKLAEGRVFSVPACRPIQEHACGLYLSMAAVSGFDQALAKLEPLCLGGDELACAHVADLYWHGDRLEEGKMQFSRWCDGGSSAACKGQTRMHKRICREQKAVCDGAVITLLKHVPKQSGASLSVYQRACDAGSKEGCAQLGLMLVSGEVVHKNRDAGMSRLRWACAQGSERACEALKQALTIMD